MHYVYFKEVKHKLNHGTVEQLILGSILSVLSNKGIFGRYFIQIKIKFCQTAQCDNRIFVAQEQFLADWDEKQKMARSLLCAL